MHAPGSVAEVKELDLTYVGLYTFDPPLSLSFSVTLYIGHNPLLSSEKHKYLRQRKVEGSSGREQ